MKYLVVGTARSGTGFISHLLNMNGIPCGHEDVFSLPHDKQSYLENLGTTTLMGESSWLAVPFLQSIKEVEPDIKLIHITRHPLKVFKSFYDLGFLDDKESRYYQEAFMPYIETDAAIDMLVSYYLMWYEMISQHERIVLDIDNINYRKVSKLIGRAVSPINTVVNAKTETKINRFSIDEIRALVKSCRQYPELYALCASYGFVI